MINNKLIYGLLILFVGFAMSLNTATAQVTGEQERQTQMQNQVQGEVVDAETDEPLSDVTVEIEGMNQEATTDENGQFTFENLETSPQTGQTETQEGGMGEQQNQNEITFTIDHEGYEQFSKTLSMDEIRKHQDQQGQQGQQGQTGQQGQQAEQGQEENPLKFELEPEDGGGTDF